MSSAEEMPQQPRASTALAENPGSVPSTTLESSQPTVTSTPRVLTPQAITDTCTHNHKT